LGKLQLRCKTSGKHMNHCPLHCFQGTAMITNTRQQRPLTHIWSPQSHPQGDRNWGPTLEEKKVSVFVELAADWAGSQILNCGISKAVLWVHRCLKVQSCSRGLRIAPRVRTFARDLRFSA
jgi:hypothetical protein